MGEIPTFTVYKNKFSFNYRFNTNLQRGALIIFFAIGRNLLSYKLNIFQPNFCRFARA